LPICGVKVEGLVFMGKVAKGLSNPTVVLNEVLVEVTETKE